MRILTASLEKGLHNRVVAEKQLRVTKAIKRRSQEHHEWFRPDHRGSGRPRGSNQTMLGWRQEIGVESTERDQHRNQCAGTQPIGIPSHGS